MEKIMNTHSSQLVTRLKTVESIFYIMILYGMIKIYLLLLVVPVQSKVTS